MKHERFISWALSTPWALMPERMASYANVLARKSADEISETTPPVAATTRRGSSGARSGAIAVVPVYGTIVQRASQLGICEGGTSTQSIGNALADALADDSVAQILLDIDSPGGSVYGVQELAAEIAGSKKPVVAFANSLAASAAYWIGAAASEFHVTPGGEVGSIGVWTAHQDVSQALAEAGVKVTLISAGDYKVEGNPYAPLGEEAQQFMQSRIDDYYGAFTRGVARGRKVSVDQVRNDMGKGRVFGADQALSANMVDSVSTLDQVITRMQKNIKAGAPSASRLARAERELSIRG
jgi:signal peptide peptidase SppA